MELFLRILVYAACGILLLAIDVWFVRSARHAFFGSDTSVVAPFYVAGKDDPGNRLGTALAQMLVARLARIGQEMEAAARALEVAQPARGGPGAKPQVESSEVPLSIPRELFQPLDVNLSVAGVEVGGVLAWVQRFMVEDRVLNIAVQFADDKAMVMGTVPTSGAPLYLEDVKPRNSDIVDAVAYSLMREHLAQRIPELAALEVGDLKTLLTTLQTAADLNRRIALGRAAGEEFKVLFTQLDDLTMKMPRWSALLRVAAEMAESADDDKRALGYYQRLLSGVAGSSAEDAFAEKVDELESRIRGAAEAAKTVPARAPVPTGSPTPDPVIARILDTPEAAQILALSGVDSLAMNREVRVAVLGGVPSRGTVPADRMRVVGSERRVAGGFMQDYIDSIVQWIRLVAPAATFTFRSVNSDSGATGEAELLAAIRDLIAARPQVLLVTFGPLTSQACAQLYAEASTAGTLVVVAAGNEAGNPVPFAGTDLLDQIVVASAVASDGQPTAFTQRDAKSVWAPGMRFPVVLSGGKIDMRNGTTYSAALTAAIAARILAERSELKPAQVVRLIRQTAKPAPNRQEPAVINLAAALAGKTT